MTKMIVVDRFKSDTDTTLSIVSVDGKFICFGLEDGFRPVKQYGETRIPSGTYDVNVRTFGGFHQRYTGRFADIHKGMLQVMNVPNFTDILIHVGNTHLDSAGCLLVGNGCDTGSDPMRLTASVDAYRLLYNEVIEAALKEQLQITFVDGDRHA